MHSVAEIRRLLVLADHGQFVVQDLDAYGAWTRTGGDDPDLPGGGWSEEAVHGHRIGVEPYSISVGTARSDVVETTLQFHPGPPAPPLDAAEHIVEADAEFPGGVLAVYGPADAPGREQNVMAPEPGRYRVRVSYLPSAPPASGVNASEPGDHFLYRIDLWPAGEETGLSIPRQGPHIWAG